MMRFITVFVLVCFSFSLAGELVLVEHGASAYQIVVPDAVMRTGETKRPTPLSTAFQQTGELLREAFMQSAGVAPEVVPASKRTAGRPAIVVGGIDGDFAHWEHHVEVRGNDLHLYGRDCDTYPDAQRYTSYCELGSVKAVLFFLEEFLGARFVFPGKDGRIWQKRDRIAVPSGTHLIRKPFVTGCSSRSQELFFDLATNNYYCRWYGTYGGHSHDKAIPPSMLKEHPEYAALKQGKRPVRSSCQQYCLSNPEVQEIIYQELLTHTDRGFEIVQLGQSDGYNACECEKCAAMYGIDDPGEKLWILHRGYAERFLKDRPGKKLQILAYGPTLHPPKSFKAFPPNVIIELAPYSPAVFQEWKAVQVTGGFAAYLYNWGWYHAEGFTPVSDFATLAAQARDFWRDGFHNLYKCGYGTLHALEGPYYYQWGRQLEDATRDTAALRREYCLAYGKAQETMLKFHDLLDSRLALGKYGQDDWNEAVMKTDANDRLAYPSALMALRYPNEVLDELEALLKQAEAENPSQTAPMVFVRCEYDYLKLTARACNALWKYRASMTQENYAALMEAVLARNHFLDSLPVTQKGTPRCTDIMGVSLFGSPDLSVLREGGRLRGPLGWPFNTDAAWMQEVGIENACSRTIRAGQPPQYMQWKLIYASQPAEFKEFPCTISVQDDATNLTVIFKLPANPQEKVENTSLSIFIGSEKELYRINLRAKNGTCVRYKREKTNKENDGNGDVFKNDGACGTSKWDGETVTVTIPWAGIGGRVPDRLFNASWTLPLSSGNNLHYIWNYNIRQRGWRNLADAYGTLQL
ncbi:MAG: DUF4838 domain-containing protein [Victivallales bacterium]|nr:DUF4838 domain-containing protein [Victivallales bacterium]